MACTIDVFGCTRVSAASAAHSISGLTIEPGVYHLNVARLISGVRYLSSQNARGCCFRSARVNEGSETIARMCPVAMSITTDAPFNCVPSGMSRVVGFLFIVPRLMPRLRDREPDRRIKQRLDTRL